jgi:hypothetical protein
VSFTSAPVLSPWDVTLVFGFAVAPGADRMDPAAVSRLRPRTTLLIVGSFIMIGLGIMASTSPRFTTIQGPADIWSARGLE